MALSAQEIQQAGRIRDTDGRQIAVLAAGASGTGNQVVLAGGSSAVGNVGLAPRASGGLSTARVIAAASLNPTVVKASPGQLYGWQMSNASAAVKFVKFYDKASAPVVGTDVPKLTIAIPAGASLDREFVNGLAFAAGIAVATTGLVADTDVTILAANDVVLNLAFV